MEVQTEKSYFDGGLLQLIGWRLLGGFITAITFGIYGLVASICNLTFDPAKEKNIGYKKD